MAARATFCSILLQSVLLPLLLLSFALFSVQCADAQAVRVTNGSLVVETAGATLTLTPPAACGVQSTSTNLLGVASFPDLQGALATTLLVGSGPANTQLNAQLATAIASSNSATVVAAAASTMVADVSADWATLNNIVGASVSSVLLALGSKAANTLGAQLSTLASTNAHTSTQLSTLTAWQGSAASVGAGMAATVAQQGVVQAQLINTSLATLGLNTGMLLWQTQQQASQLVSSEVNRALAAESSIGISVSAGLVAGLSGVGAQLTGEVSRATALEAQLAINASLLTSAAIAASNSYIMSVYNSVESDTSTLRAANNLLRTQLQSETSRALAAEATLAVVLSTAMAADASQFASAQAALYTNISSFTAAETSRAVLSESNLNTSALLTVAREATRMTATVSGLYANLTTSLSAAIGKEYSAATVASNTLSNIILTISFSSPPSVSGTLWYWLDGSDPTGKSAAPTTSFNPTVLYDKGPNAIHLDTRTGGAVTDIVFNPNVKNGRGAIYMTGNAYISSSKQTTTFAGTEGVTWFVVYKTPPDTTQRSLASLLPVNSGLGNYYNWWLGSGGTTERWESGQTPRSDTFNMAVNTWVVSVGRQGTSLGHYHMNTYNNNLYTGGPTDTMSAVSRGVMLGNYVGSYFNNYVAEFVIYNNYLSDADMNSVYNWLRAKWAI